VVDDYTIDFLTTEPNPLFPSSIANFMIMDRGWAEKTGRLEFRRLFKRTNR
jgi:peptide/nickel transport system substrate-binding protein